MRKYKHRKRNKCDDFHQLETRLTLCGKLIDEFSEIQAEIEEVVSDADLEAEYKEREAFSNEYFHEISKAKKLIFEYNKNSNSNLDTESAAARDSVFHTNVKLPPIQVPKFSGDYETWLEFRETFESLIHTNESLTGIQKFHYLKVSLAGNAAEVVSSLEFSANNYAVAWDLLCDRYNNSRLLVQNHIKAIFNIQAFSKESSKTLRNIIDTLSKHLKALKQLNQPAEHWDTLIIYIVTSKLDTGTIRDWEEYISKLDVPKLSDLKSFLKSKADLLETIELKGSDTRYKSNKINTSKVFLNNDTDENINSQVLVSNTHANAHDKSKIPFNFTSLLLFRYEMHMDAVHPEDTVRRFILSYSLADGSCMIQEPPIRNSGIIGGKYLRSTLLVKPGSDPLNPDLYTPVDFYIGALIVVYSQRFIITGADLYVYRYMQENSSKFPCEVIENMRNWMFQQGHLKDDIDDLVKDKFEAERKFDETMKDEQKITDFDKCLKDFNVGGGDIESEADKQKHEKILQEYEDSIKHTYKVPPYGILPVNKTCAYPIYTGEPKDLTCSEDIEGKYALYTPKHIDTPEEVIEKYYAGVLKDQQQVCDGRYPIECTDSPSKDKLTDDRQDKNRLLRVSPPDIPSGACKIKQKTVKFEDEDKCARSADDLCDLKTEKTHCDCTDYLKDCL
ncbi:uncharacterized protein LOC115883129 [Sitophilus oryzae]|uniref:Uncharacterized protein LOC115883129 n=1 Tax=Sitophilus oryzae TaxID=7048 RepID=A0A6J2Y0R4_SITOR|nr:uncharacterized protein LOC115883129 [Sitophilus oryzae]